MTDERRHEHEPDPSPDPERDARSAERDAQRMEREARWAGREAERDARRAERRAQRHEFRVRAHGGPGDLPFDAEHFARSFVADFVTDAGGDSYTETVEKQFSFEGRTPRLRVRNISGETSVRVGEGNEIRVVARKYVVAGSEDRAKRLLQNLEARMEQRGDELRVEPHLYEQERAWLDLFRGRRVRVDFDITVPRECAVDAQTVSGGLSVEGTRGPIEAQSVSGDVKLEDLQGPMRLKTVSGNVDGRGYVGHLEGNTVSGDVSLRSSRLRSCHMHTVSGDVEIEGSLDAGREHRFKSISGDVELALADADSTIEFRTASGDLECDVPSRIVRHGKKEFEVILGDGHAVIGVKTVSGDLTIRGTSAETPGMPETPTVSTATTMDTTDMEETQPMVRETPSETSAEVRAVLERLARGELGVEDAAAALDAVRKAR